MLNIFSTGYVIWDKNDYGSGLTASYTQYEDALDTWRNFHQGPTVESFGIPLQDYLYDAQTNFEIWATRNNMPINALNFWIFATGQHITEALERLNVDTSTLGRWNDYINVMKSHVNSALDTHDTRTKQNLLTVLESTIKKTADDIADMYRKGKESLDPTESILPWIIGGVVVIWLLK
tara:strand:+ start:1296 stop:1829 length:534 start_codon:yes stop_codon:yes gene_type:complete